MTSRVEKFTAHIRADEDLSKYDFKLKTKADRIADEIRRFAWPVIPDALVPGTFRRSVRYDLERTIFHRVPIFDAGLASSALRANCDSLAVAISKPVWFYLWLENDGLRFLTDGWFAAAASAPDRKLKL